MKLNEFNKAKRLLLIDDDPDYGRLFSSYAFELGMDVKHCVSLAEMGSVGSLREYDALFLDYDLEKMNGIEIAEYVDVFFRDKPVFLISANEGLAKDEKWPRSIKRFIPKNEGIDRILKYARDEFEFLPAS